MSTNSLQRAMAMAVPCAAVILLPCGLASAAGFDTLGQVLACIAALAGIVTGYLVRGMHAGDGRRFAESVAGEIDQIMIGAAETSHFIDSIKKKADQDFRATQDISARAEHSASGTAQIAANAERAASVAADVRNASMAGRAEIDFVLQQIGQARIEGRAALDLMAMLREHARRIYGITDAINKISSRTSLLALNASIEAAHAGEHGRGFAVVASEVRQLAQRTRDSTDEIGAMVQEINEAAERAASGMAALGERVVQVASNVEKVHSVFGNIEHSAAQSEREVQDIVSSSRSHVRTTRAIAESIRGIHDSILATEENLPLASRSAMMLSERAETLFDAVMACGTHTAHDAILQAAKQAAHDVGKVFEAAIAEGRISEQDLFDRQYVHIPDTDPPKFTTRFDSFTDSVLPPIQEAILAAMPQLAYAGAVDNNGYFPTHNRRFSQPLTGDYETDLMNNRTKRIFSDRTGQRCGSHTRPFLLQTYKRDTGEVMHDLSVPIHVGGRHWGGFRIGYRSHTPLAAEQGAPAAGQPMRAAAAYAVH